MSNLFYKLMTIIIIVNYLIFHLLSIYISGLTRISSAIEQKQIIPVGR